MSLLLSVKCRLNGLRSVKSESLEPLSQVTQLDLRDNCLDSLDLSSICNLETLHCQRNQLGTLTLSGFTLRMLHASSNRESKRLSSSCYCCLTICLSAWRSGPSPRWCIHLINTDMNGPDLKLLITAFICPQALQQSTSIPSLISWHTWIYHSEFWLGKRCCRSLSFFTFYLYFT